MIYRPNSSLEQNGYAGGKPRPGAGFSPEKASPENAASRLKSATRQADWRRANPLKYAAHIAVQRALARGRLEKKPCEVCGRGDDDGVRIDAHHDDYRQPLKVRWLCRSHHNRLHAAGEDMFATASRGTERGSAPSEKGKSQ